MSLFDYAVQKISGNSKDRNAFDVFKVDANTDPRLTTQIHSTGLRSRIKQMINRSGKGNESLFSKMFGIVDTSSLLATSLLAAYENSKNSLQSPEFDCIYLPLPTEDKLTIAIKNTYSTGAQGTFASALAQARNKTAKAIIEAYDASKQTVKALFGSGNISLNSPIYANPTDVYKSWKPNSETLLPQITASWEIQAFDNEYLEIYAPLLALIQICTPSINKYNVWEYPGPRWRVNLFDTVASTKKKYKDAPNISWDNKLQSDGGSGIFSLRISNYFRHNCMVISDLSMEFDTKSLTYHGKISKVTVKITFSTVAPVYGSDYFNIFMMSS